MDIIEKLVLQRASKNINLPDVTVGSIIDEYNLYNIKQFLADYKLELSTLLTEETSDSICRLLMDHWDIFIESQKIQTEIVKRQFIELVKGCKKVAIVDVGWLGSGPIAIKRLIEKEWNLDCKCYCFVAASKSNNGTLEYSLMDRTIEPYIFSKEKNRIHLSYHTNRTAANSSMNTIAFELFTQATSPSFAGLNNEGDYLFNLPETENYKKIEEIHKGILDYTSKHINLSKTVPALLNISGYDAYCPFRLITRNKDFIKNYLGDIVFIRGVSSKANYEDTETIRDIFGKFNM